ncbi:unnamed protein product [Rotaria sordida]|uniref:DJ-1/PfpI domain-containing protein n=1 Tax=Rotaria sordida TaxID=392033 RepID=A0A813XYH0_9BILA|nr:unnamed protein product [Rotaria sordida]CAF3864457.1 unnamed protein product [Rotaria sordida]
MAQTLNRVLIAVTSANLKFWPLGLKTGYFWTEVLHPYETFKNHGYEVDLVSETGTTGMDESSSGHGAAFDFPKATGLQRIGSSIYQNGGVIGSLCHGPAIFANLKVNNQLLIKGKKVTAFTKGGEKLMMATDRLKEHNLPFMEDLLRDLGADWQEPPNINPMSEFVVVDGRLVSGVNPASASIVAQKAVEIVKGVHVEDKQPKKSIF